MAFVWIGLLWVMAAALYRVWIPFHEFINSLHFIKLARSLFINKEKTSKRFEIELKKIKLIDWRDKVSLIV